MEQGWPVDELCLLNLAAFNPLRAPGYQVITEKLLRVATKPNDGAIVLSPWYSDPPPAGATSKEGHLHQNALNLL
jgi:hypothetical protein